MIFVSLGTHRQPMRRLVPALEGVPAQLSRLGPFVIQHGVTPVPRGWTGKPFMTPGEMEQAIRSADIVVTHCGPATIALARSCGRVPIVVPRLRDQGEHVDDHQQAFGRHLRRAGEIVLVEDPNALIQAIASYPEVTEPLPEPVPFDPSGAIERFAGLVDVLTNHRGR